MNRFQKDGRFAFVLVGAVLFTGAGWSVGNAHSISFLFLSALGAICLVVAFEDYNDER